MGENSETIPNVTARYATFREIRKSKTGGAQSFCKFEGRIVSAACMRGVSIRLKRSVSASGRNTIRFTFKMQLSNSANAFH
jgi:hypothetical protein